jgi:hypothetical protein
MEIFSQQVHSLAGTNVCKKSDKPCVNFLRLSSWRGGRERGKKYKRTLKKEKKLITLRFTEYCKCIKLTAQNSISVWTSSVRQD